MLSVLDLFSIGIGPSSSHTVGPMRAARRFTELLTEQNLYSKTEKLKVKLYGSLSATGRGHGTDSAVVMGLMGCEPETIDPAIVGPTIEKIRKSGFLDLSGETRVAFDCDSDISFEKSQLPFHPNALEFQALTAKGKILLSSTYYSIGGGFIVDEHEAHKAKKDTSLPLKSVPFDFDSAEELLELCNKFDKSISAIMLENELSIHEDVYFSHRIQEIWQTMQDCVVNGCESKEEYLPGKLRVPRRAPNLYLKLASQSERLDTKDSMDWVNLFALAVNEENAAGGRIVTAPTNGAAGIIPAVLHYYMEFCDEAEPAGIYEFLLTAGAIGIVIKTNASISGAEVGCQGEVGSASAMAAAGLCAVLGGTPEQIENAAEIALEHSLGLTCDPIGGLVQIPCIERNAIASNKAINAAKMALHGDGRHMVSLDQAVWTMGETGADMMAKYKETSLGGLAVALVDC